MNLLYEYTPAREGWKGDYVQSGNRIMKKESIFWYPKFLVCLGRIKLPQYDFCTIFWCLAEIIILNI